MQTYTANEAKTRFGEFLDRVQREPVRVDAPRPRGRRAWSAPRTMRRCAGSTSDRLRQTLRETAEGAAAAGLTEEKLAELLADES